MRKIFVVLAAIAMLVTVAVPAMAGEMLPPDPNQSGDFTSQYMGERVLVDVLVVRPVSFAASLIGLTGSIAAYPFGAMSNSCDRVSEELVQKPWAYTFTRPVGDIDF